MNDLEVEHSQEQELNPTIRLKHSPAVDGEETPIAYSMRDALSRKQKFEQLLLSLHEPEASADSVVRRSSETNQRQYARCPLPETGSSAILTVKGRSYDCQLVEVSIGGFGVVVPGLPKLPIGADGYLRAPGFNYVIKITRQEIRSKGTFIGLRQVEEIVGRDLLLLNGPAPILGYLIAGVAGALIATLMYYYKIGA